MKSVWKYKCVSLLSVIAYITITQYMHSVWRGVDAFVYDVVISRPNPESALEK